MGLSPSRQASDEPSSPILSTPATFAAPASVAPSAKAKSKEESSAHVPKEPKEKEVKASRAEKTSKQPATGSSSSGPGAAAASASTSASSAPVPDRLVLKGHSAEVIGCSWNPRNGDLLASCSADSTVRIWTLQGTARASSAALHHGAKVKPGMTPPSQVTALQWDPLGSCLASACFDGTVRFWDAGVGIPKTQLNTKFPAHTGAIYSVRWSPSSTLVATGGADGCLNLWTHKPGSTAIAAHKFVSLHSQSILDIDFGPHHWIASASVDRTIKIVDSAAFSGSSTASGSSSTAASALFSLEGHSATVNSVRWAPDADLLASGSEDKTIKLWRPEIPPPTESAGDASGASSAPRTVSPLQTLTGHSRDVYVLRWNPKVTAQLASASYDGTVKIWEGRPDMFCSTTLGNHSDAVVTLDFSSSGKLLATGSHDKSICVWDTHNGKLVKQYACSGRVLEVALSHAEDKLAACCSDNSATIFDLRL